MKSVIVMLKEDEFEERKAEIAMLAETGGYEVTEFFVQDKRPRARFLIGKGKVREIRDFTGDDSQQVPHQGTPGSVCLRAVGVHGHLDPEPDHQAATRSGGKRAAVVGNC